jgi:hypothetical protein
MDDAMGSGVIVAGNSHGKGIRQACIQTLVTQDSDGRGVG